MPIDGQEIDQRDIPLKESRLKSSESLPLIVTKETPMGMFALTVLDLIERQTGLPVTDRNKLFDFEKVVEIVKSPFFQEHIL